MGTQNIVGIAGVCAALKWIAFTTVDKLRKKEENRKRLLDIAKLADVLGHSSIETTRIYLRSSGDEHARLLDRLHLLL